METLVLQHLSVVRQVGLAFIDPQVRESSVNVDELIGFSLCHRNLQLFAPNERFCTILLFMLEHFRKSLFNVKNDVSSKIFCTFMSS